MLKNFYIVVFLYFLFFSCVRNDEQKAIIEDKVDQTISVVGEPQPATAEEWLEKEFPEYQVIEELSLNLKSTEESRVFLLHNPRYTEYFLNKNPQYIKRYEQTNKSHLHRIAIYTEKDNSFIVFDYSYNPVFPVFNEKAIRMANLHWNGYFGVGDFNGNGLHEIVVPYIYGGGEELHIHEYHNNGFKLVFSTGLLTIEYMSFDYQGTIYLYGKEEGYGDVKPTTGVPAGGFPDHAEDKYYRAIFKWDDDSKTYEWEVSIELTEEEFLQVLAKRDANHR